jgi:hypothetical protein
MSFTAGRAENRWQPCLHFGTGTLLNVCRASFWSDEAQQRAA